MSIKDLVGKRMEKKYEFMGTNVVICKLSVDEVLKLQEAAKDIDKDQSKGFDVLKQVIKVGVKDADQLSDEDFNQFPLDDLTKLSNEIMKYSGMNAGNGA